MNMGAVHCDRCEAQALSMQSSAACICGGNVSCSLSPQDCRWGTGKDTGQDEISHNVFDYSNQQHDWELEVLTNIMKNSDSISHEALQFFPDYILLITNAMLKVRKDDE